MIPVFLKSVKGIVLLSGTGIGVIMAAFTAGAVFVLTQGSEAKRGLVIAVLEDRLLSH